MVSIPLALLGRYSNAVLESYPIGLRVAQAYPASPLGKLFEVFRPGPGAAAAEPVVPVAPLFDIYWQGYHQWFKHLPDHPAIEAARGDETGWYHQPATKAMVRDLPLMSGTFTREEPWYKGHKPDAIIKYNHITDAVNALREAPDEWSRAHTMLGYFNKDSVERLRVISGQYSGHSRRLRPVNNELTERAMHAYRPQAEWLLEWLGRDGVIEAFAAAPELEAYRREPFKAMPPNSVTIHGQAVSTGALIAAEGAAHALNFADTMMTCPLVSHTPPTNGDVLEYITWLFNPDFNYTIINTAYRDKLGPSVDAALARLNRAAHMPDLDLTAAQLDERTAQRLFGGKFSQKERPGLPFYIQVSEVFDEKGPSELAACLREMEAVVHPQLGMPAGEAYRPAKAWEWLALLEAVDMRLNNDTLEPALYALRSLVEQQPGAGVGEALPVLEPCLPEIRRALHEAGTMNAQGATGVLSALESHVAEFKVPAAGRSSRGSPQAAPPR